MRERCPGPKRRSNRGTPDRAGLAWRPARQGQRRTPSRCMACLGKSSFPAPGRPRPSPGLPQVASHVWKKTYGPALSPVHSPAGVAGLCAPVAPAGAWPACRLRASLTRRRRTVRCRPARRRRTRRPAARGRHAPPAPAGQWPGWTCAPRASRYTRGCGVPSVPPGRCGRATFWTAPCPCHGRQRFAPGLLRWWGLCSCHRASGSARFSSRDSGTAFPRVFWPRILARHWDPPGGCRCAGDRGRRSWVCRSCSWCVHNTTLG